MIVLLDMDGVVADFTGKLIEMYNHLTNEGVKMSDIRSVKTTKWVGDPYTMRKIIDSTGFIRNLSPLPGAIDGVREIHKAGHKIFFVSNGTNCTTSGHEKRDWLNYYFGDLWKKAPLVLTYYKHLVRGDCLVDDNVKNLQNLHPTTHPLLWHQPYNADVLGYERVYDWSHLLDWIKNNET